ncbi:MAG: helix-turn-helix domain-containing protein [Dehalococcoidia bacterium]|nr:helix-turn-helix domain-containing protein [Dehalococcoidia bacterium]
MSRTSDAMDHKFYTTQEIADIFRVDYMTVYRWIRAGKLKAYKIEKQYRITELDLERFLNQRRRG